MSYPKFYDTVESIKVKDELSAILATFENGEYEIGYIDVVKSAGHSCPTVAGAYIMTSEAMKALYKGQRVVRGNIKVEFKEDLEDGVAGVIGNVISHITGATDKSGFKGLNGKFARHSLMHFSEDISSSARFTRVDTGKSVDIFYDPSSVLPAATMQPLMQKVMGGIATEEEVAEFGKLWQERVEKILCHHHDREEVLKVVEVS
jgi:hypothetical protein